ncbi:uncharacterized protein [Temnothorax nylanderi]|uniref:uncharacterized protein n=1 Tax=Temnothorax nylanderi TaxID=102681 RepID=UPI003A8AB2E7
MKKSEASCFCEVTVARLGHRHPGLNSPRNAFTRYPSLFLSFQYTTCPSERGKNHANSRVFSSRGSPCASLLLCTRSEDTVNCRSTSSVSTFASDTVGCQRNASSIPVLVYQHSCVTPSFTCLSPLASQRRSKHAALPPRHSETRIRSLTPGTGATQTRVAVISSWSGGAKESRVDEGKPATPLPSSHLAFAPCPPSFLRAPRSTISQETRIPRRHPITSPPSCALSCTEARPRGPRLLARATYRSPRDDRRVRTTRWQCPGSLARRPPRAGSPFFSPAGRISRDAQCRAHPVGPTLTVGQRNDLPSVADDRTIWSLLLNFALYESNDISVSSTPTRAPTCTSRVWNHVLTIWRLLAGLEVIADDAGPHRAPVRPRRGNRAPRRNLAIGSRRERVEA